MEPNAPLLPFLPPGAWALSDEQEDVRDKRDPLKQAKIDLNRLGLYEPPGGKGLSEELDTAFVAALKNFQRQAGITASGSLDDGITPQLLERAVENNNADSLFAGWYVWRTVGDGKVRGAHAAREGQVFSWDNPPDGGHPGEDYNCRCWAQKYVPSDPASRQRAIEVRDKARARQKATSTSGKLSIPFPPDPRLLQEAMTDPEDPFHKNLGGEIRGALRPGGGKSPKTPVGRRGEQNDVKPGTNKPSKINGRRYTGHALDQMQARGFTPRVVENTIKNGVTRSGKESNTSHHYDSKNNISVITNSTTGDVITVRGGK